MQLFYFTIANKQSFYMYLHIRRINHIVEASAVYRTDARRRLVADQRLH